MRFSLQAIAVALLAPTYLACAGAAEAGFDAETVREFLLEGLEANRQMDIAFAGAIPDSAMRWAPNDVVRDFAEQVAHTANNYWTASGQDLEAPAMGDTAAYLNDKDALIAEVNRAYDWVLDQVRNLPADQFEDEIEFFGSPTVKWRVYTQAIEHATWTRGQMVPYFHAHGVDVPPVTFF